MATDPVVFAAAMLVGVLAPDWRRFLVALSLVGLAVHLLVSIQVATFWAEIGRYPNGFWFVVKVTALPRLAAFIALSLAAFGLSQLGRRFIKPQTQGQ